VKKNIQFKIECSTDHRGEKENKNSQANPKRRKCFEIQSSWHIPFAVTKSCNDNPFVPAD
jgi:hypothetical protein